MHVTYRLMFIQCLQVDLDEFTNIVRNSLEALEARMNHVEVKVDYVEGMVCKRSPVSRHAGFRTRSGPLLSPLLLVLLLLVLLLLLLLLLLHHYYYYYYYYYYTNNNYTIHATTALPTLVLSLQQHQHLTWRSSCSYYITIAPLLMAAAFYFEY